MTLKPNNIDIRQTMISNRGMFNKLMHLFTNYNSSVFPSDNDLRIVLSELFKEIYKELSDSNELTKTYVDIKDKFNQLCRDNFWTNDKKIFQELKNNFKKRPYNFKENLKLAIKKFLEPISYNRYSTSSNAKKGTKFYLASRKNDFYNLIKTTFSKIIVKNIENKIKEFITNIIKKNLEDNTDTIKINELKTTYRRIMSIMDSDIWNNNFFNIKNALKHFFNFNDSLKTDIFKKTFTNFRNYIKDWIREVISNNDTGNITYWEYKQDLVAIWKRRYTNSIEERHQIKGPLKIASIISWELAKKIRKGNTTIDELNQLIVGIKSSLNKCGINFDDITSNGLLEYSDDSNNENRYKRGSITFSIYLKKDDYPLLLNQSTKFAQNISLNERITMTINQRLISHLNSMLVTQKFHLIDERDLLRAIPRGMTLKKIRDFEDENTNSHIELTWQEIKNWLFPNLNIEEIDFENDIKNAFDNNRNITFKYYLKLKNLKNKKVSQLIVKALDNDSNEFLYSIDLLQKFGEKNKEYKSLFDKILTKINQNDINWSTILSKIWLNQFLDKNLNLINDINQNKFMTRVGVDNILIESSSQKYKNQVIAFNNFRKNSRLTSKDSFKLRFTVEIRRSPTGDKNLALLLHLTDDGLENSEKTKKIIFLKSLSLLNIAKKIPRGPYKAYSNFSYDKINSYLEVINAINLYTTLSFNDTIYFIETLDHEDDVPDQTFFPELGEPLDFNKFKMKKNGKIISFQEIINYIKSQGFENVQVSNVKMGGAKNNRQGVDITFSTSYYIFDANSQNKETATYTIFLPIEIKGVEPEYIESQKQKVVDFVMKNWQKDERFPFKPKKQKLSRSEFLRLVDSSYNFFKNNGKYKGNISKKRVDYMTEHYLEKLKFLSDPRTNMKNLRKLYENQEIPKDVLEMNRDKEISSIFSRIFKTKGWENSRKLRQKIKKLIESKNLMKLAKNSSRGIQKLLANSFRQINKINKKVKYVYFGSGIALAVSSVLLLSNAISKFKISKKAKKMNINLKSSRIAIRASSILAVLTLLGSVAMNVIFFIVEKGF